MSDENLVFVDKQVIGRVEGGVFCQLITQRHIFRELNAKGIDASLFISLSRFCHSWQLTFRDTKQVLSIPFKKILLVGVKRGTGAGQQYLVKLEDFNNDIPVLQHRLL